MGRTGFLVPDYGSILPDNLQMVKRSFYFFIDTDGFRFPVMVQVNVIQDNGIEQVVIIGWLCGFCSGQFVIAC